MSLTAEYLMHQSDSGQDSWPQPLTGFSCHMRNTAQAAGRCEGHFGVGEADVSLDTTPLERSLCVVNRASAVGEKHT